MSALAQAELKRCVQQVDPVPLAQVIAGSAVVTQQDFGNVTVMAINGAYDRGMTAPRQAVAAQFYATHPDQYDFLVVFTTFEFDSGDAVAFYNGIQNDTLGLGQELFDNSTSFGSAGRLQGYIDMAAMSRYDFAPTAPAYKNVLNTFAHELMHRWGIRVHFLDAAGSNSTDLIGYADSHWSYFLDTDASVMYGNDWQLQSDGKFHSVDTDHRYSPLDMYLAGLANASEVPSFTLIRNGDGGVATDYPRLGAVSGGQAESITIDQVIAASGARVPAAADAQKSFSAAIILLKRPGEVVPADRLLELERFRVRFQQQFVSMTDGRGILRMFTQAKDAATVELPEILHGSGARSAATDVAAAIAWIESRQRADGHWQDRPATAMRDTVAAVRAIEELDPGFAGLAAARAWIVAHAVVNADQRAWKLLGADRVEDADSLTAAQNAQGGFGILPGWRASAFDTAIVASALANHDPASVSVSNAVQFVGAQQNTNGSYGVTLNGRGRILPTLRSATLFATAGGGAWNQGRQDAVAWLATLQKADGGLGDGGQSSLAATIEAYSLVGPLQPEAQLVTGMRSYVRQSQQVDGDWGGSIYLTATAALAYAHDQQTNLLIAGNLAANPAQPYVGEQVTLSAVVRNNGTVAAIASTARWFDGDPAQGGVQIGSDTAVPSLVAGSSAPIAQVWDTSGIEGSHEIWLVLDADDSVAESSEEDNRGSLTVNVGTAPVVPDLVLTAEDFSLDPAAITSLPSQIHLSGVLHNLGTQAVTDVAVALYAAPDFVNALATATVDVPATGSVPLDLDFSVTEPTSLSLVLRADPDNSIAEAKEANNEAHLSLPYGESLDLEVTPADVTLLSAVPSAGQDIEFEVNLRNLGTVDSPAAIIHAEVELSGTTTTILDSPVQIAAGEQVIQHLVWRTGEPGSAQLRVSIDPSNQVAETSESNNTAAFDFSVQALSQADLTYEADSLHFAPDPGLQGQPFAASLLVRNLSSVASGSFRVAVYAEDPRSGAPALGSTVVADLAGSTAAPVTINVPDLGIRGDQTLYALIDADEQIVEFDEANNVIIAPVRVRSLPDVAISVADIALTPALPVPGQSVQAQVTVRNLGDQDAQAVVIRMLEGDARSGVAVGADQSIPTLAAGDAVLLTWDWTLGVSADARQVTAIADPSGVVREGSDDNNTASLPFDVQDGNFFASQRYISPDGDGVQDQTAIVFVSPLPGVAEVQIANGANYVVRHFTNVALNSAQRGQVIWDGRDDKNHIVPDGDYHVIAIDAAQQSHTGPLLTVDNNLSSALEAVHSKYGVYSDVPFYDFTIPPAASPIHDQMVGFSIDGGKRGVYRSGTLFPYPMPIISGNWFAANADARNLYGHYMEQFVFNADGSEVALIYNTRQTQSSNYVSEILLSRVTQVDAPRLLATLTENLSDADVFGFLDPNTIVIGPNSGGALLRIDIASGAVSTWRTLPQGFSLNYDVDAVILRDGVVLTAEDSEGDEQRIFLPRDTAQPFLIIRADDYSYDGFVSGSAISPQGRAIAVHTLGDDIETIDLIDLQTGVRTTLMQTVAVTVADPQGWLHGVHGFGMRWEEDTNELLVQDAQARTLTTFSEAGEQVSQTRFPALKRVGTYDFFSDDYPEGERRGDSPGDGGDDSGTVVPVAQVPVDVAIGDCGALGSIFDPTTNRYFVRFGESLADFYRPGRPAGGDQSDFNIRLWGGIRDYFSVDTYLGDFATLQKGTLTPLLDGADIAQHPLRVECEDSPPPGWPSLIMNDGARLRMDGHVETLSRGLLPRIWPEDDNQIYDIWPDETRLRVGNRLFTSLLNQTAVVQARTVGRGVEITGIATDRNFAYYKLDWAPIEQANDWRVLTPAVSDEVFLDEFLTWVPPEPGTFIIRLTVVDRAGNQTTTTASASSFDRSAIDRFALSPRYISPNGDGVQDNLQIKYNVRSPVTVDISIRDVDGNEVRFVSQTYDSAVLGPHEVLWNGRDDAGQLVPDGRYRVNVEGFAAWITVDTVAPEVGGTLWQAYRTPPLCAGGAACASPVVVKPGFEHAVQDVNLAAFGLEAAPIGVATWSLLHYISSHSIDAGKDVADPRNWSEVDLDPALFARHQFRLRATDRAGNSRAMALGHAQEALPLDVLLPVPTARFRSNVHFFYQPPPFDQTPVVNDDPPIPPLPVERGADDSLVVWDISGQLTGIAVEVASSDTPDQWTEVSSYPLADVSCPQATGCSRRSSAAEMRVPLLVDALPLGSEAFVRVRGERLDGSTLYSNQGYIHIGGITPPFCHYSRGGEMYLTAIEYYDGPLGNALVHIGTQIYAATSILSTAVNFTVPRAEHGKIAWVSGIDSRGFLHHSDPFVIHCPGSGGSGGSLWTVKFFRAPVVVDRCDGQPSDKIAINFSIARTATGEPLPRHIRLSYVNGVTNQSVVLLDVGINEGNALSVGQRVVVDTSGWPEGSYEAQLEKTYSDGSKHTDTIILPIVKQPPQISITRPADGQRVCALPGPKGRERLPISGIVDSVGTSSYRVAIGAGAAPLAFECEFTSGEVMSPFLPKCPPYSLLFDIDGHSVNGTLGTINDELQFYNGISTVQLKGLNWSGGTMCTTSTFFLDSTVEFAERQWPTTLVAAGARIPVVGIAPQGDEYHVQGQFFLNANEPVQVTATLHNATLSPQTGAVNIDAEVLATLSQADSVQGNIDVAWNGRINGIVAADGLYGIVVTAIDACGLSESIRYGAFVDSTPPAVVITAPISGTSTTAAVVDISGSVTDNNLLGRWSLDYALASSPLVWQNLESGSAPVTPADLLEDWSRGSVTGQVDLRLSAVDAFGNAAEAHVLLTLLSPAKMIAAAELQPALFSPNADAVLDASRLQLSLLRAANLAIEAGGVSIYNGPASAGIIGLTWDGKNASGQALADGTYPVVINAKDPNGVASPETVTLTATIDNTPPTLTVLAPTAAFAAGTSTVRFHVEDLHLVEYQASLTRNADGAVVATRTDHQGGDITLTALHDFEEGGYSLHLVANDGAGNVSSTDVSFELDATPPEVSLLGPVDGALIAASKPSAVVGSVNDVNLAAYTVSVASQGTETWIELMQGTTNVHEVELLAWTPNLPDGVYQLRLRGVDKAGNTSDDIHLLTVDGTAPVADIISPADGSTVAASFDVNGTATDAHFNEYRLSIIAASQLQSEQWADIYTGTTEVDQAKLAALTLGLAQGDYVLRLVVTDKVGLSSSDQVDVRIDTEPPTAPLGLIGHLENGNRDAVLDWNAVGADDLAGYIVYRGGAAITATLIPDIHYVDVGAPEGEVVYYVTAVDYAGNESATSNRVTLIIDHTPPTVSIAKPAEAERVRGAYPIIGTAYSADDFKQYRLSMQPTNPPGPLVQLASATLPAQGATLASWDTVVVADETEVTIRLEGEDTNGNIGVAMVNVIVDNGPPAAPTGLSAVLTGADVQTAWNPNTESDLLGYLLYRDNELVNADDPSLPADLRPFSLPETEYLDEDVPDGTHTYVVYAIDQAGNVSPPSAPASIAPLDNHPPSMVIEQPDDNTKFETDITVFASSPDSDIAQVQFAWTAQGSSAWTNFAAALTEEPYRVIWTPPVGTPYGNYEIRALATDLGGSVDPSPPTVTVVYADLTPPDAAVNLEAHADADSVHLTWQASAAPDLAGYWVYRGCCNRINGSLLTTAAYDDEGLDDDSYTYTVVAVDDYGNEAVESNEASADVFSVALKQPYSPSSDATVAIAGTSARPGSITLHVETDQGSTDTTPGATSEDGAIALAAQPLALGANLFQVQVTDDSGDISNPDEFWVDRGNIPAAPIGVAGSVLDHSVSVTWNPNSETDLLGYRVFRNGNPVAPDLALGETPTVSTDGGADPANAIDGDPLTWWRASPCCFDEPEYWPDDPSLELEWTQPRIVTVANLSWSDVDHATGNLDFYAWSGDAWIHIAELRDAAQATQSVFFDKPYRSTRLKLVVHDADPYYPRNLQLAEIQLFERPVQSATTFTETVIDGAYVYQVSALSTYAFESPLSDPVELDVGDAVGPDAVVLSGTLSGDNDANLSWTASTAADVARYELLRDGAVITTVNVGNPLSFVDVDLLNGAHEYLVYAYDGFDNASPPSNTVTLSVSNSGPGVPTITTVFAPPEGSALDITWEPGPGVTPVRYILLRAQAIDDAYTEIAQPEASDYRDQPLTNDTLYCYKVKAVGDLGGISAPSTPVCATPHDSEHPDAPVLTYPTVAWDPVTLYTDTTLVCGYAEPSANVELDINDGSGTTPLLASTRSSVRYVPLPDDRESAPYVAPDGEHIAVINGNGLLEVHSSDDTMTVMDVSSAGEFALQWAAHGTTLYILGGLGDELLRWRLGQSVQPIALPISDIARFAVNSDESTFAVVGTYTSGGGAPTAALWIVDEDGSNPRQVTGLAPTLHGELLWSPDHSHLLSVGDDGIIRLLDTNTASIIASVPAGADGFVMPTWSPDGSQFAFVRSNAMDGSDVVIYDLASESESVLFDDFGSVHSIAWSPAGETIAVLSRFDLVFVPTLVDPASSPDDWDFIENNDDWDFMLWSSSGGIFLGNGRYLWKVDPAGWFCADDVPLAAGTNLIAATATDASGQRSLPSAAIEIHTPTANLPDLAVSAADILFLPPSGAVGQSYSALVTLHNVGTEDIAQPALEVTLSTPDGSQRTLSPLSALAALPVGGAQLISYEIGMLTEPGAYRLHVLADPYQQVREVSEGNNVAADALTVSSDGLPVLELNLSRNVFAPEQVVEGELAVTNPGSTFSGHVHVNIVDATDTLVADLGDFAIDALGFGERWTTPLAWDASGVLAGDYKMQAKLLGNDQSDIANATSPFAIAAVQHVQLALVPDPASQAIGQPITLHSHIAFTSGNAPITGASMRVQVLGAGSTVVWEATHNLGTVQPGTALIQDDIWSTGGFAEGTYALRLSLTWPNGSQSTDSSVNLVAAIPIADVGGSIEFTPASTVVAGLPASLTAHITNTSTLALAGVQSRLRLVTAQDKAPVANLDAQFDLAVGATHNMQTPVNAPPLALTGYIAILEARLAGDPAESWRLLAQQGFTVVDQMPPEIGAIDPLSTVLQPAIAPFRASIVDQHSAVASAALRVDAGTWQPVSMDATGYYTRGITDLSDGPHTLSVRAEDTWGNQALLGPLVFNVDATPPVIVITGVSDDDAVNYALTPQITITDTNLASSEIHLNGEPYASATIVDADGHYVLSVRATDEAGNNSLASVRFLIDQVPPQVVFVSPLPNAEVHARTVDVVGLTEPMATVHLWVGDYVTETVADESGQFTAVDAELELGNNVVLAFATDRATNQGRTSLLKVEREVGIDPCPGPADRIFTNGFDGPCDRIFADGFDTAPVTVRAMLTPNANTSNVSAPSQHTASPSSRQTARSILTFGPDTMHRGLRPLLPGERLASLTTHRHSGAAAGRTRNLARIHARCSKIPGSALARGPGMTRALSNPGTHRHSGAAAGRTRNLALT